MKKLLVISFFILFLGFPEPSGYIKKDSTEYEAEPAQLIKAFPSAFGCGAYADGFRGGEVIHVTSLADDYQNVQAGTLRWALTRTYPRIIVFDVSGTITLSGMIFLGPSNSNFYLAGQTSPNGIMVRGYSIYSSNLNDAVIRHIKFYGDASLIRADNDPSEAQRPSWQFVSPENVMVDHCDFVYNANEAMNFWSSEGYVAGGATMQNCIIGEGDTGVLMGGDECNTTLGGEYSAIHNLFTHISHRHPNFTANVLGEAINNVVYNPRIRMSRVSCTAQANFYGNYYKDGSVSVWSVPSRRNLVREDDGADVYIDDNFWSFMTGIVDDANDDYWEIFVAATSGTNSAKHSDPQPSPSAWLRSTPVSLMGVRPTILSNSEAYTSVLSDVGANRYLNEDGSFDFVVDPKQQEYIDDVTNTTNTQGDSDDYGNEIGNYNHPNIASNTRPAGFDTDGDGMPNVWETNNGLNPNVADDDGYDLDSSYTNIEEYLNSIEEEQTTVGDPPVVTAPADVTITVGDSWTPPAGSWTDTEDGSGTIPTPTGSYDTNTVGSYVLTYSYTDTDSNIDSDTMTLTVEAAPAVPTGEKIRGKAKVNGKWVKINN